MDEKTRYCLNCYMSGRGNIPTAREMALKRFDGSVIEFGLCALCTLAVGELIAKGYIDRVTA